VYQGFWFAPEREALQQLIDCSQRAVSGEVRLRLCRGHVQVTGRRSDNSLYDPQLATFEADAVYDQADAAGFIRLQALRLRQWAARHTRT
ncbi:MAG: argininosuccinate synthase, partial [Polyangiales bacterium]